MVHHCPPPFPTSILEGSFWVLWKPTVKPFDSDQTHLTDVLCTQVNARLGGGPVSMMNELVWGVDLVEEQMLACAGIPSKPYIASRPNENVAEYSVNAKQTGIIKSLDFLQVPPPLSFISLLGLAETYGVNASLQQHSGFQLPSDATPLLPLSGCAHVMH